MIAIADRSLDLHPRACDRSDGSCTSIQASACLPRRTWCGRPDLNRHRPWGPTDFHTIYGFRRRPFGRLWSGLYLHLGACAL